MVGGDPDSFLLGGAAFTGSEGGRGYEAFNGNTYVMGDMDGDGSADFWVRLDGLHTLTQGDFIV